jgi:pyruvate dehydrogenase E2 component (dihydrolipoamide acetyltransferase)
MSGRIVAVIVPKWGLEMTEGTVSTWLKSVGDTIREGEPLLEIESEKIVNSVDAPADGVLRRILIDAGGVGAIGSLAGVVAGPDVPDQDIDQYVAGFPGDRDARSVAAPTGARAEERSAPVAPAEAPAGAERTPPPDTQVRISPPVRRLADKLRVPLADIRGSGPNGRILLEDVELAARAGSRGNTVETQPGTPEAAAVGDERIEQPSLMPWSATRRSIARKMQEAARDIPHFYLVMDVEARALLARREAERARAASPSINDLIVHATSRVLTRHPQVNANSSEGGLLTYTHAHVAVAMATSDGVVAPVVRFADRLDLSEVAQTLSQLRGRASERRLRASDVDGASFTVSNLGMFGVREFTSIITAPQCASLAVGGIRRFNGSATLSLTLSCDHRALDGATGAAFLRDLRDLLESG